jgi:periplasmic protein TonB
MAVTMPATGASTPRAERPLMLDACLVDSGPAGQRRRRVTLPVSIALHTAAAFALIAVPLLVSDAMPEVQTGVRAFLVEPLSVAPPPPPPAARPAVAPRVAPKPVQQQAFIAPVEVPQEIVPEQALDLGSADQGVSGGVEGGIPGGVVGGIVGGLPDAPAPVAPVRVGGSVREPRRLTAVPPVYPELALKARLQGTVIIEATVNERGRVVDATLLQGLPMLTEAALEAVKKWTYTPTLVNGVPTPIIMTVTVHFRLS